MENKTSIQNSKPMLRVGDKILWRALGADEFKQAVIDGIELDCRGGKNGRHVSEASWEDVHRPNNCVVTMTNGRWAYGYQIKPD